MEGAVVSSKTSYRIRITLIIVVVICLLLALTLYIGSFLLQSHYTKKGSFTYYILIPDYIKDFPVIEPISEPTYYSIPVDGHPGYDGIVYKTRLDQEAAYILLSNELRKQGFLIQEEQIFDDQYIALNSDNSIVINIIVSQPEEGQVEIRAYKQY